VGDLPRVMTMCILNPLLHINIIQVRPKNPNIKIFTKITKKRLEKRSFAVWNNRDWCWASSHVSKKVAIQCSKTLQNQGCNPAKTTYKKHPKNGSENKQKRTNFRFERGDEVVHKFDL
jgi:hypothetical protein